MITKEVGRLVYKPSQGACFILTFTAVGSANAPATRYGIPSEAI